MIGWRRDPQQAAHDPYAGLSAEAWRLAGRGDRRGLDRLGRQLLGDSDAPADVLLAAAAAAGVLQRPVAVELAAEAAASADAPLPAVREHALLAARLTGPLSGLRVLAERRETAPGDEEKALLLPPVWQVLERLPGRPGQLEPHEWLTAALDPRLAALGGPRPAEPEALAGAAAGWIRGSPDDEAAAALLASEAVRSGAGADQLAAVVRAAGPAAARVALEHLPPDAAGTAAALLEAAPEVADEPSALIARRLAGKTPWPDLRLLWERRIAAMPADPELRARYADELIAVAEVEEALHHARAAWLLRPDDREAVLAFAARATELRAWEALEAACREWLERQPHDLRVGLALVRCYAATGREDAARALAEATLAAKPPGPGEPAADLWIDRAWMQEAMGELKAAADTAARAGLDGAPGAVEQVVRLDAQVVLQQGPQGSDPSLDRLVELASSRAGLLSAERLCEAAEALVTARRAERALDVLAAVLAADRGAELAEAAAFTPLAVRLADPVTRTDPCDQPPGPRELRTVASRWAEDGQRELSALALVMASLAAPGDEGLALAGGLALISAGRTEAAEALLGRVSRVEGRDIRDTVWPRRNAEPWPAQPLIAPSAWADRLPPGARWPRISVVTPSFNQAAYLEDTLRSIAGQQYPNLQLIVVDGGSTDGSLDILKRWRRRIDVLIVGQDSGQTDALNKGFARADGELLCWLNSDDLFAPGALHRAALAWLESGADLVAGMVLAFRDGRIETANLPGARADTFTVERLADIAGSWNQGFFFYQPEVLFTRELWLRAGGRLDDRLDCVMDYEFWLRCAQAGARLEVFPWPVAMFRHHPGQKSGEQALCLAEQAEVRDRFIDWGPPPERAEAVRRSLKRALTRRGRVLALAGRGLAGRDYALKGWRIVTAEDPGAAEAADLLLWAPAPGDDPAALACWRERAPGAVAAVWLWRPDEQPVNAQALADVGDLVLPGRADLAGYLRGRQALMAAAVPPPQGDAPTSADLLAVIEALKDA